MTDQTGNKMARVRGKIIYDGGGPKDTSAGKDLGKDATNAYAQPGPDPPEASPSSTSQSRNR